LTARSRTVSGAFVSVGQCGAECGGVFNARTGSVDGCSPFRHKRDAESYDAEVKRRLRLGEVGIIDGARITLDELHDRWKDAHYRNLAPATVAAYDVAWVDYIESRLGRAKLGELRVPTLQS